MTRSCVKIGTHLLINEAAATEVPVMRRELLGRAHRLRLLQLVDAAQIVQATTRDHVVGGGLEGTSHDP